MSVFISWLTLYLRKSRFCCCCWCWSFSVLNLLCRATAQTGGTVWKKIAFGGVLPAEVSVTSSISVRTIRECALQCQHQSGCKGFFYADVGKECKTTTLLFGASNGGTISNWRYYRKQNGQYFSLVSFIGRQFQELCSKMGFLIYENILCKRISSYFLSLIQAFGEIFFDGVGVKYVVAKVLELTSGLETGRSAHGQVRTPGSICIAPAVVFENNTDMCFVFCLRRRVCTRALIG